MNSGSVSYARSMVPEECRRAGFVDVAGCDEQNEPNQIGGLQFPTPEEMEGEGET
jgi:hypothetical protein